MSYTCLSLQMKSQTIQYPTQETYEQLQEKYLETLQCPCKQVSIEYGKFVDVEPVFHQVCSSDLISQDWIDFTFVVNSTVLWPMDVRASLSTMWQLMAALCQSSQTILIDALKELASLPLVSPIVLSKELLQTKIQAEINSMREASSNNIEQPLTTIQLMSEINRFISGLSLNYLLFSLFGSEARDPMIQARKVQYINQGSTTVCNCHSFGSCQLPGNIYLYDMWETNSTFDLNIIVANETIPGIVIDCTPSYSQRFDWIYVLTTLIALIGGLNVALRLLAVSLVNLAFSVKNILRRPFQRRMQQNDITSDASIKIRVKRLFKKLILAIIQLNLIDKKTQNPLRLYRARIATRFYIGALIIAISIVILYTSLEEQTIRQKIEYPSQQQYEELIEKYPETITCPCATMSIPYQAFIEIKPTYHQLCESDFIQRSWYSQLILSDLYLYIWPDGFLNTAPSYFQALGTFCDLVNLTVNAAIRRFHSTDFVNDKLLPSGSFKLQMDSIIYSFFNSTRMKFLYTISLVNAVIHTNQYLSGSMTNVRLQIETISEMELYGFDPEIVIAYNIMRLQENSSYCSCAIDTDCYSTNAILAPQSSFESYGFASGCYIVQTALQSSLECWYNITCIDTIRDHYGFFGTHNQSPSIIDILDSSYPSRFSPNDNLKVIVDELMIEQWNIFSNYNLYYYECQVVYCSFTHTEKASVIYMVTTIIGLFGGLSITFRLISIFVAKIFIKIINPVNLDNAITSGTNQVRPFTHNLCTRVRQEIITYNLFDDDSTAVELIHKQRWSTRTYLCLLIFSILIIVSYTILMKQTTTKLILTPTQEQYTHLVESQVDQLQCPCSNVAIPHREFLKVNTTIHQVCSSHFVASIWFDYLFQNSQSSYYRRRDLRARGFAYFKLLSLLCILSQTTVMNSTNRFLAETFIMSQMISEYEFGIQINVTIDLFKRQTSNESSRIFQLVRNMLHGNGFISSYFLNWNISAKIRPNFVTYPVYPIIFENGCSCGTRSDCIESGGIYHSFANILYFVIPGWRVGCSSVETLLRSTLECFYNQTCVDMLMFYSNTVESKLPNHSEIKAMNLSLSSRFTPNTTIQIIVDELFIEDWQLDVSYSAFYEQCSPTFCSYKYESRKSVLYALSRVLSFYGGITVSLRFLVPYIIVLTFKIRNYYYLNRLTPLA